MKTVKPWRLSILLVLSSFPVFANATLAPTLPANALKVPYVRQAVNYSCGVASLLSVLMYWGAFDSGESALYSLLGTSVKDGTRPEKLVEGAKYFGLKAELRKDMDLDDLRRLLKQGATVILGLQAWVDHYKPDYDWANEWENGHYIVLIGMDDNYLYAMDPSVGAHAGYIPLTEFILRWHDYETVRGKRVDYVQSGTIITGTAPVDHANILERIY